MVKRVTSPQLVLQVPLPAVLVVSVALPVVVAVANATDAVNPDILWVRVLRSSILTI